MSQESVEAVRGNSSPRSGGVTLFGDGAHGLAMAVCSPRNGFGYGRGSASTMRGVSAYGCADLAGYDRRSLGRRVRRRRWR